MPKPKALPATKRATTTHRSLDQPANRPNKNLTKTGNNPLTGSVRPRSRSVSTLPKMAGAARGATKTVHMYGWDRGHIREVQFYGPIGRLWNCDTRSGTRAAIAGFAEAVK